MSKKEFKKETIETIDIMIDNVSKGPSGFWTDDYEGCGNPLIFPEFYDGLKKGRLVQKKHYLCPWNTAVLYGEGHGNIHTGCYHSCSMRDAKYLTEDMLKDILMRFRTRLVSGVYDNLDNLKPLLRPQDCKFIEKRKVEEANEERKKAQVIRDNKIKQSKKLVEKFNNNKNIQEIIQAYYGDNVNIISEYGCIDFSRQGFKDIVGGEKLTYDDYIELQFKSYGKYRSTFAKCFHNIPLEFKGKIKRIDKDNILFERIYICGMYPDGDTFDGKEEHVWMSKDGFEDYQIGDNVSFWAEVYRYIKTGNGKILDYGLRNPENIKRIEPYELPTNRELIEQDVDMLMCETCYLSEQCNRLYCLIKSKEKQRLKKQMVDIISSKNNKSEN